MQSLEMALPILHTMTRRRIRRYRYYFYADVKNKGRGLEQLEQICDYWQRMKVYPQGKSFSLLNVTIAKEPNKIGRDEDGVYHFSCILNCEIYY